MIRPHRHVRVNHDGVLGDYRSGIADPAVDVFRLGLFATEGVVDEHLGLAGSVLDALYLTIRLISRVLTEQQNQRGAMRGFDYTDGGEFVVGIAGRIGAACNVERRYPLKNAFGLLL
jgi:hypothetical protein